MRALVFISISVIIGFCALAVSTDRVNKDVVDSLRIKRNECERNVEELKRLGFYTVEYSARGTVVFRVKESAWAELSYDDKIRQGLLIYCARMPADGKLVVRIEGHFNGKQLGAVVDGNWLR